MNICDAAVLFQEFMWDGHAAAQASTKNLHAMLDFDWVLSHGAFDWRIFWGTRKSRLRVDTTIEPQ